MFKIPSFKKFEGMILYRFDYGERSTLGIMTYKDKYFFTLELPWKDNKKRVSCIPEGDYTVVLRDKNQSGKFKYDHLHILDVPNRSYILFHVANYPNDILGCIGTGKTTAKDFVGSSVKAHEELMELFGESEKLKIVKL